MNYRFACLFTFCIMVSLWFTGCVPKAQPSIPVTGKEDSDPFELARENVLKYIVSSSRIADTPPDASWQLDMEKQLPGRHHFRSGDWLMVIWDADENGNQRVVVANTVENVSWCGYVRSDGHVVDTAYSR